MAMDDPLFEALFAQSAAGIAVFSIGGRFLRANPALCRLLGYTEQELLQKTHLDVIHMEDLESAAVLAQGSRLGLAAAAVLFTSIAGEDDDPPGAMLSAARIAEAALAS